MTDVVNSFGTEQTFDTVSAYGYGYDALGRRTHKANVGAAFGAAHFDVYGYNGRSELTTSDRWTGTGPDDANKQDVAGDYGYAYDPIGNRLSYDPAGANTVYYCSNNLNQYTTTDDAATCPPSTPAQSFAYDEDGNLVYEEGGSLATPRAYVYDAENRLIQVGPAGSPAVGDRRVTFTYDYRGRRVKQVGETWSGSGWISELRLFVWDDWKMLLERRLAQVGQPPPTRAHTWGLDLAGQRASGRGGRLGAGSLLEGAGTIGGLLAVADGTGGAGTLTYVYCYDANGNVGQVVDPAAAKMTAALVATYEYDPYGGVLVSSGAYAATNPVRFSTKYWDDATGLGYWGYRFYRADLGRWVNRDPIGEEDGPNITAFVRSAPTNQIDTLGERAAAPKPVKWRPQTGWPAVAEGVIACRIAGDDEYSDPECVPSPALLLCLAYKESALNPTPGSGPYRGVGQMSEGACRDVDRIFELGDGECWRRVNSGDACEQIGMVDAYLRIKLKEAKCDMAEALILYGGWTKKKAEGMDRYVNPVQNCEKCLQEELDSLQAARAKESPDCYTLPQDLPWSDAQPCFDNMTKESSDANKRWSKTR